MSLSKELNTEEKKMYCKNCGKELLNDEKHCNSCGHSTDNGKLSIPRKTSAKEISKSFAAVIAVIAVAVVGITGYMFADNRANDSPIVISQLQSTTQAGRQDAKNIVIHWSAVKGSTKDDWNVYTPYVDGDYLYIKTQAQLNSSYTVQYRGFGYASINDTFSKTVPIDFEYENSTVENGEYQDLTLRIPVTDLDVQRPTTLYVNLAAYIGGRQDEIRLEFNISW